MQVLLARHIVRRQFAAQPDDAPDVAAMLAALETGLAEATESQAGKGKQLAEGRRRWPRTWPTASLTQLN